MLVKFLLCGLASLTIGLKSTAIEKSSIKDGSYINGRFYSDSFVHKIINNLDNGENSLDLDNLQNVSNRKKNVNVVVELYDNDNSKECLINEDNYDDIMSSKKLCIKNENERVFNLLNFQDYSSYYKCENLPFLVFEYDEINDFYETDLSKLSNYECYIKNVFLEKENCYDCASRNEGPYEVEYPYEQALIDVGISGENI